MPFNFLACFSVRLSGARRLLATGCEFNKSNKAFLWLAACSPELSRSGRHCFIHLLTCTQGGVEWGPGAGSAGWLGQAKAREACAVHKGDRWCPGQCPKTSVLGLSPATNCRLEFG